MSTGALVATLLLLGACAPEPEESAPAEQAPAPAPLDSAPAPADTMARDTASP